MPNADFASSRGKCSEWWTTVAQLSARCPKRGASSAPCIHVHGSTATYQHAASWAVAQDVVLTYARLAPGLYVHQSHFVRWLYPLVATVSETARQLRASDTTCQALYIIADCTAEGRFDAVTLPSDCSANEALRNTLYKASSQTKVRPRSLTPACLLSPATSHPASRISNSHPCLSSLNLDFPPKSPP